MTTLLQDLIQEVQGLGFELPYNRFFKPTDTFWEKLLPYKDKLMIDCGTGGGDLLSEAGVQGFSMTGCDIHKRAGVALGVVQIRPAHSMPYSTDTLALVCRPDHSGWFADLVPHVLSRGSSILYLGLPENMEEDLPLDIPYEILATNAGVEGEVMILYTPPTESTTFVFNYQSADTPYKEDKRITDGI